MIYFKLLSPLKSFKCWLFHMTRYPLIVSRLVSGDKSFTFIPPWINRFPLISVQLLISYKSSSVRMTYVPAFGLHTLLVKDIPKRDNIIIRQNISQCPLEMELIIEKMWKDHYCHISILDFVSNITNKRLDFKTKEFILKSLSTDYSLDIILEFIEYLLKHLKIRQVRELDI